MARRNKIQYTKRATSYQEQINLLKSRGVQISDDNKAREYLSDIGHYRLGFYIYPFEQTYPFLDYRRLHTVQQGTTLEEIVAFYYYDLDLRNILNRYLSRIEIDLRTTIIYELSNRYPSNPWWHVDPTIVDNKFITKFALKYYPSIKEKEPIKRHHGKYIESFAPAWKTIEYMTLGNLENLYDSLLSNRLLEASRSLLLLPITDITRFNSYLSSLQNSFFAIILEL